MTREHGIENTVAGGTNGPALRRGLHRERVEKLKAGLRDNMAKPGSGHVYGEEWFREHTRLGNFAEADAIEELLSEIREHNRRVEDEYRARADRIRREAVAEDYKRRQERGEERARIEQERNKRGKAHKDSRLGSADREKEKVKSGRRYVNPLVPAPGLPGTTPPTLPPMGAA